VSVFVPPFLVYLLGAPLLLLLRGRARQVCLVALAAVGAAVTFLLGEGTGWSVRFMEYDLVLLRVDRLSLLMGYIFSLITLLAHSTRRHSPAPGCTSTPSSTPVRTSGRCSRATS